VRVPVVMLAERPGASSILDLCLARPSGWHPLDQLPLCSAADRGAVYEFVLSLLYTFTFHLLSHNKASESVSVVCRVVLAQQLRALRGDARVEAKAAERLAQLNEVERRGAVGVMVQEGLPTEYVGIMLFMVGIWRIRNSVLA
jgi:hypothetical protein